MDYSQHARVRTAQRRLSPAEVELVCRHGREIRRTGVTFYFLGRRDVPPRHEQGALCERLVGTVLLVAADGQLITAYRNRNALKEIRRKSKRRARPAALALPDASAYPWGTIGWHARAEAGYAVASARAAGPFTALGVPC